MTTLTLERASDLAARGYGSIETEVWGPNPEQPGYLLRQRVRTVAEVVADIRAAFGTNEPAGAEEGMSVFENYTCYTPKCEHAKYSQHVLDGTGVCTGRERGSFKPCPCMKYLSGAEREWPAGRIVVFTVRGSSEGYYTHLSVVRRDTGAEDLVMLAKTCSDGAEGRDAAWAFARKVADLLGV